MNNRFATQAKTTRRGSAMIAGIFVVLVVSVLSMSYLSLSLSKYREHATSVDAKRAFYTAEAGLAESYAALMAGQSGTVGSAETPAEYAGNIFWVEATPLSGGRTQLKSTGLAGIGRQCLSVVVSREEESIAELGIFGDDGITIGIGATIDSYDSRVALHQEDAAAESSTPPGRVLPGASVTVPEAGASADTIGATADSKTDFEEYKDANGEDASLVDWLASDEGNSLLISSNGDIVIEGFRGVPRTITGDVTPGPTGGVRLGPDVTVTGSTTPRTEIADLQHFASPDGLTMQTDLILNSREQVVSENIIGKIRNIVVGNGAKLTIKGPSKIVVDSLEVQSLGSLEFDTTEGVIKLFVNSEFHLRTNANITNPSMNPARVLLAVNGADQVTARGTERAITLWGNGEFYGFFFAPNAQVELFSGIEVFGSVVAKELVVADYATIHFDEALLDVIRDDQMAYPEMISWRFTDLPDVEIVKTRMEPNTFLRLKNRQSVKASEAHDKDWDGDFDLTDRSMN